MSRAEIDESHAQFRGAWRQMALGLPRGEVVERPEVYITAGNVTWSMMNMSFLNKPAETEAELLRAVDSAASYYARGPYGWAFTLTPEWLAPSLRAKVDALLESRGLKPGMTTTGMVADTLREPAHPLPPLEFRRVEDEWGYNAVADINAISYDTPQVFGREALAVPGLFGPECRAYVGCREGDPATTTSARLVDGIVYIALVATLPEYRRKSAAEAVMRRALEEARKSWGVQRTVLHATVAGAPVYRRMGYRDVTNFVSYFAPGKSV
jgi:ribosomal protein S18 acetylase RimI-like enzyme